MAKTIEEILDTFEAIQSELARTTKPPLDLAHISKVSLLILDLAEDIAVYSESEGSLDLWAKDNLADALVRLQMCWQFAAINHLSSIFWDRSKLSPSARKGVMPDLLTFRYILGVTATAHTLIYFEGAAVWCELNQIHLC